VRQFLRSLVSSFDPMVLPPSATNRSEPESVRLPWTEEIFLFGGLH
jgi:hypothetical protein